MADDTTAPALPTPQLTLPINPPVIAYGPPVNSITLREPTAHEMAAAESAAPGYAWRIAIVAAASGLNREEVGQFGVSLMNDCMDYVGAWITARASQQHAASDSAAALRLTH